VRWGGAGRGAGSGRSWSQRSPAARRREALNRHWHMGGPLSPLRQRSCQGLSGDGSGLWPEGCAQCCAGDGARCRRAVPRRRAWHLAAPSLAVKWCKAPPRIVGPRPPAQRRCRKFAVRPLRAAAVLFHCGPSERRRRRGQPIPFWNLSYSEWKWRKVLSRL
jgi:hypothetical protein